MRENDQETAGPQECPDKASKPSVKASGPWVLAVLVGSVLGFGVFSALYHGLYNNMYLSIVMALTAGFSLVIFLLPEKECAVGQTIVQKSGGKGGAGPCGRMAGLAWCILVLGGLYLFTTNFAEGFSSDAMLTAGLCGTVFVMAGRAEALLPLRFSRVPPQR